MTPLHVLVLAAGKGTRMKSGVPKVLHHVAGRPMIDYVLDTAASLQPASCTVVVGHMADLVRASLASHEEVRTVVQEPQLGTGHALMQAAPLLGGKTGLLILLSGDVPRLTPGTLRALVEEHWRTGAAATLLTAVVTDPSGYGRVVRDDRGVARVVEHRDASPEIRELREINSGIYVFDLEPLFPALSRIAADNDQKEYYLPDLVGIFTMDGRRVSAVVADNAGEVLGINSRSELAAVSREIWRSRAEELMASGVTIEDPDAFYPDAGVTVGRDTTIHQGVTLQGTTSIGSNCVLYPGVRIVDSTVGDGVVVLDHCLITGARIAEQASVGPFARIRPDTVVEPGGHIGNFVELKKTRLGAGSKAMHLAYLGDCTIGERVNIGAGTITCNYDGEKKNPTIIEDGAFIGSDTQLVAPVRVGRGAYVAAGSSITKDVPPGALGIARGRQENIEGWVEKKRRRKTEDGRRQAKDRGQ